MFETLLKKEKILESAFSIFLTVFSTLLTHPHTVTPLDASTKEAF